MNYLIFLLRIVNFQLSTLYFCLFFRYLTISVGKFLDFSPRFIRDQFVQSAPFVHELKATQQYLDIARDRIRSLESENAELKKELETCKPRKYSQ